jgi:hypothetical protein
VYYDVLQSSKFVDGAIWIFPVGEERSIMWGCETK